MERSPLKLSGSRLALAYLISSSIGCVANPLPVPTVWDRLGIPQATARVRDSTINRNGRFPALEKKPPLLKIADPANLKPEKPEMIKTAAKIKTDQDLKKQKLKAIAFLAEVNCGCYNKDDGVAKAFLEAMADCDPDVRKAAIEGLSKAAGNCSKCRTGCETTCCTEEILKKAQDMATGMDANCCFKEPDKEIRSLAAALVRKCPLPPAKPIEEIPAPPSEIEELTSPEETISGREGDPGPKINRPGREGDLSRSRKTPTNKVAYRIHDSVHQVGAEPVIVAKRGSPARKSGEGISNPDQLVAARVVSSRTQLGEILVEMHEPCQMTTGWTMVVVDATGKHQVGRISESGGRRVLLTLDSASLISAEPGSSVRIGLVSK